MARFFRSAALAVFLLPVAGFALAQEEGRIIAVVDGKAITNLDLADRTKLVVFANGLPDTTAFRQKLMPQVLNTLIDEELQRQEANRLNVKVRERQIHDALAGMEQRNNLPPGGLDAFLESKGVAKSALESQIESSLLWSRVVDRRLRSQVDIGDEEIDEALRTIRENQGKPQHLVSEIFLSVDDSATESRIRESALRIVQQIREGVRFEALARAFSQSATAATGGDLGWLRKGQLDQTIEQVVVSMQRGQIAGPVRSPDGYHILLLRDRRLPGGASAGKVTVDLIQVGIPLSSSATEAEIQAVLGAAEDIRGLATDCPALAGAQLPGNAKAVKVGRVSVADLAPALQVPILELNANQISGPIRTQTGVLMFMVCDRDAPAELMPDREKIRQQLVLAKLNLLARRYLRDLRRAATVDIRK